MENDIHVNGMEVGLPAINGAKCALTLHTFYFRNG